MSMILVADSGSTKTTWCIIPEKKSDCLQCITPGLNPFLQTEDEMADCLGKNFNLSGRNFNTIFFYGAGCANQEKIEKVRNVLAGFFDAGEINVDSDLMAAARSLCGTSPGIAAILGTGSNCCYYDGRSISKHVPPLGYILGDEGGGAVLGKKLLADILKNRLPGDLTRRFFEKYSFSPAEILDRVYRQPFPNRFMARFTFFISENIDDPAMHNLVRNSFREFLERNISQFPESGQLPVNVTGSIAWHFRDIFVEAVLGAGFTAGKITSDPMEGLIEFHKNQM